MHQDGSNSARARSARIRTAHDGEANELESMRRRAAASELRVPSHVSLVARLRTFLRGARTTGAESLLVSGVEEERAG
jgi:hypothetical protein